MLNALAILLLTLLGAAGESLGMDRLSLEPARSNAERPFVVPARVACSTASSPTCPSKDCGPSATTPNPRNCYAKYEVFTETFGLA